MAELIVLEGSWLNNLKYVALDVNATIVQYKLAYPVAGSPWVGDNQWSIVYDKSTKTWSDAPGATSEPNSFNSVDDYATSTVTVYNPEYLYGYSTALIFKVANPWYEASTPPNTNSNSDASVSYVVEDNELRIFIPSDKPSSWDPNLNPSGRNLYYQLRKVSGTNFWTRFYHINGFPTNETIVPTTAGIYQLEKVLTNPLDYLTYNTVEVTQAQLDVYATNNPPDDDPPENDPPPTPVFIRGSGCRGNLNFW